MHFPVSTSVYDDDVIEFEFSGAISMAIGREEMALRVISEFPGVSPSHSIRCLAREAAEAKICWITSFVWFLTWVNSGKGT